MLNPQPERVGWGAVCLLACEPLLCSSPLTLGFSHCAPYSPYIIGTMNQATSSTPNLQLHHNFR